MADARGSEKSLWVETLVSRVHLQPAMRPWQAASLYELSCLYITLRAPHCNEAAGGITGKVCEVLSAARCLCLNKAWLSSVGDKPQKNSIRAGCPYEIRSSSAFLMFCLALITFVGKGSLHIVKYT